MNLTAMDLAAKPFSISKPSTGFQSSSASSVHILRRSPMIMEIPARPIGLRTVLLVPNQGIFLVLSFMAGILRMGR